MINFIKTRRAVIHIAVYLLMVLVTTLSGDAIFNVDQNYIERSS